MTTTLVVAGASGVVGAATIEHVLESTDWNVIAISRRPPSIGTERPFTHLALDLRDLDAVRAVAPELSTATHLVYAALFEKPGLVGGWTEADQMTTNALMFDNLIRVLTDSAADLQHVSLMQGTKAYGAHLHPIPIPAKESQPRDAHENFYFLQEDRLRHVASARGLRWTILRPQVVMGGAVGAAMNLVPALGAYAAVCRGLDEPFAFPGGASYVWEAVDARLCAQALTWAAYEKRAADEIFNLANGDVFEWRNLWAGIADTLGVDVGPDHRRGVADFLRSHTKVWDEAVSRHELRPLSLENLVGESDHYADLCFNLGELDEVFPRFVSSIKIRQAGFDGCFDTEASIQYWLERLIDEKYIPAFRK